MQKKILGRTGLDVSIIGFGAIKLPGVPADDAVRIINRALDLGVNYIDTARNYRDRVGFCHVRIMPQARRYEQHIRATWQHDAPRRQRVAESLRATLLAQRLPHR